MFFVNTPLLFEPHACEDWWQASCGTLRGKIITCEGDIACGSGVLCTPPIAYKGIATACKRKHLESVRSFDEDVHHEAPGQLEDEELLDGRTANPFRVDTLGTVFGSSKLLTSSLSNLILGVSGVAISMLLMLSLISCCSFLVIVSLIDKSVFTEVFSTSFQELSFLLRSACVAKKCDLRLYSRRSGRKNLRAHPMAVCDAR